jgi:hypothetical protein
MSIAACILDISFTKNYSITFFLTDLNPTFVGGVRIFAPLPRPGIIALSARCTGPHF